MTLAETGPQVTPTDQETATPPESDLTRSLLAQVRAASRSAPARARRSARSPGRRWRSSSAPAAYSGAAARRP